MALVSYVSGHGREVDRSVVNVDINFPRRALLERRPDNATGTCTRICYLRRAQPTDEQ